MKNLMIFKKQIYQPLIAYGIRGGLQKKQEGAVLIVGLVLLLVLTIIGTSSMSTVTLEERMASNMQNANKAFQGAEAALVACENAIQTTVNHSALPVAIGMVDVGSFAGTAKWWDDSTFWAAQYAAPVAALAKSATNPDGLAALPTCVTEYIGNGASPEATYSASSARRVYRITAFSYGSNTKSQSVVESIYVN